MNRTKMKISGMFMSGPLAELQQVSFDLWQVCSLIAGICKLFGGSNTSQAVGSLIVV